jgi:hypothetical protein
MTLQFRSFATAIVSRLAVAWLGAAALAGTAWAADEPVRIDFRNKVPGILDARIFGFDSVTGLGSGYVAHLMVGDSPNTLDIVRGDPLVFLDGPDSGYLPYETPQERAITPSPDIGDEVWFSLRVYKYVFTVPFGELLIAGSSDIHSMVVTNSVMPLVGLESFSLVPERLLIRRQAGEVVVRWPYLAAQRYELQTTSSLLTPVFWSSEFEWSGVGYNGLEFSVTNVATTSPQIYRLQRWDLP